MNKSFVDYLMSITRISKNKQHQPKYYPSANARYGDKYGSGSANSRYGQKYGSANARYGRKHRNNL